MCDIWKTAPELHPVQQVYDQREALTELETGLSPAVVRYMASALFWTSCIKTFRSLFFGFSHTQHYLPSCLVDDCDALTPARRVRQHIYNQFMQQKYGMFKGRFTILKFLKVCMWAWRRVCVCVHTSASCHCPAHQADCMCDLQVLAGLKRKQFSF